jgi:hypothetical protein
MTEQEVRALVRDVIAKHAGGGVNAAPLVSAGPARTLRAHASHGMFVLPAGADTEGPCIIEPTVACNHCGYCKSYGH